MADDTTIRVDKDTRRRLNVWAAEHEMTQREAINELIDRDRGAGSEVGTDGE